MNVRAWAVSAAAVLATAVVIAVVVTGAGTDQTKSRSLNGPANTATVERGRLSATVAQDGILTFRGQADGSPYTVVNRAAGVYTELPASGDRVACGEVLYRVDDRPVMLLCGATPAYRSLRVGATGRDVRQLNRSLGTVGDVFTTQTAQALGKLQRGVGARATGALPLGDAVFLPEPLRVAKLMGAPGGTAGSGAPVLTATSDEMQVQVALHPSRQGEVSKGDAAQIMLPGNRPVGGRVSGFGRVASSGPDKSAAAATVPTYIGLDKPRTARGLDRASVGVSIRTAGIDDALSVPVTALVGRSGGGLAVEVVRSGTRRELVAVDIGLFDTGGGRVQVEGDVRAGDAVAVPSS